MQLEDLRGWMRGEDCVVAGCGPSAEDADEAWQRDSRAPAYRDYWTIACNLSCQIFVPDFVMCVEPYDDGIWTEIRKYAPVVTFSHVAGKPHLKWPLSRIVQLGSKNVLEWLAPCASCDNVGRIDGGKGSYIPCPDCKGRGHLKLNQCPFYAVAVAALLGFETIGLIGVDLSEKRYGDAHRPNAKYAALLEVVRELGSEVVNLSPESRLTSISQAGWERIRRKNERNEN